MKRDIIGDRVAIIWHGNDNEFTKTLGKQNDHGKKFTVIDSYKKFHDTFLPQLEDSKNEQFCCIIILAELNWRKWWEQSGRYVDLRGIELAQLLRLEYAVISPILICSFLNKDSLEQYYSFRHFDSIQSLGVGYFQLPVSFINKGKLIPPIEAKIPTHNIIRDKVSKVIFGIKADTHNESLLFHLIQIDNKLEDVKEGIDISIYPNLSSIEGIIKFIARIQSPNEQENRFPYNAFKNLIRIMNNKEASELRKINLTIFKFFHSAVIPQKVNNEAVVKNLGKRTETTNEKPKAKPDLKRNYTTTHILFFPEKTKRKSDLIPHIEVVGKVSNVKHLFITIFYENHLESILKRLPINEKINIWVHYNYGQKETNLDNPIAFFDKFPIEKYFITSGEVNTIMTNLQRQGYIVEESEGLETKKIKLDVYFDDTKEKLMYKIYSNKIFTGKDIGVLPPSKTVREILNSQFTESVRLPTSYPQQKLIDKIFNNRIKRKELATILAYCFKKEERRDKKIEKIEIIPSGFSGALLLKIKFDLNKNYVIKLDQNLKQLKREWTVSEKIKGLGLSNERFIFSEKAFYKEMSLDENEEVISIPAFYPILNWYGLRYELANEYKTILDFIKDASLEDCKECLLAALTRLEDFKNKINPDGTLLIKKKIWQRDQNQMALTFPNKGLNILIEIQNLLFGANIEPSQLDFLVSFIEGKSKNKFLTKDILIPLAFVHGDFHSGNILIDTNGKNAKLIDFALTNFKKRYHAFYDLAKLSVNLELSILKKENLALGDKNLFDKWVKVHNKWIVNLNNPKFKEKDLLIDQNDLGLRKIYILNEIIKQKSIGYADDATLINEKENFAYQFEIVRLHFFLKSIAYTNLPWQKRLFALKASLNIINYFKNENLVFNSK